MPSLIFVFKGNITNCQLHLKLFICELQANYSLTMSCLCLQAALNENNLFLGKLIVCYRCGFIFLYECDTM